ncbi:MAG: FAD-dependent oxidoreductase [Phycisphaerae bacterium]|jgi:NADPH-dependent glutamate synthase beta subunit-like oxidoreductase/2,4-dienoyl-CoA reductase-like NADH-dependent reductase (Old Yellow Enzyme family)
MNTWKYRLTDIAQFKSLCSQIDCRIDAIEDVSILAQPVRAGGLFIPNSLSVHPMEGADGDSYGRPGPLTFRRYKRFASGGAGLLWAEAIAVTSEGRANPRQLWLNEDSKDAFAQMVKMMRDSARESIGSEHKPVIVAQLTHSGRYSKPEGIAKPLIPQRDPYRDSLVPEPDPTANKQSRVTDDCIVTDEYLDNLIAGYVKAAKLAFEAGFNAVDIKSCHGYLINELLASRNRKGKYGGSFENRTGFLLEVIDRIHSELGDDKQVAVRLGFYDAIPFPFGWGVNEKDYTKPDLTEPKKLLTLLSGRGVKMINFTIANPYYNPHVGRPFNQPIKGAYDEPEHPLKGVERLINLAGEIQSQFPDVTIVGTGYSWLRQIMGNVAAASKKAGKSKIIGAGRMAFAYPDFAKDILTKGKLDKSKVCIGCSGCTQLMRDGQTAGCVIRDSKIYGPIFRHGRMSDKANLQRLAQSCLQCEEPTCQLACPAGIDIPLFIKQFLDGDEKGAYQTIRKSNILPEICAWLCPVEQQCQGGCLQKFIGDSALPIADIQRYLAEQANKNGWSKIKVPVEFTGKNIAIIGAGPAGLSAAAVLLESGHKVTIFDKAKDLGGMIESVIPSERQGSALKNEIAAVFKDVPQSRMELRLNTEINENFNLDNIMVQSFDAAFIGFGLPKGISSSNEKLKGLYDALEFLNMAKQSAGPDIAGKRVAVIGGGNTAMDAAITAKQLGAEDVYVIYRRSFEQMPAWTAERDRAIEQGVNFLILTHQLGYESENGRLTGVKVCPVKLAEPDKSGRRRPVPDEKNAYKLSMDIVAESIGQTSAEFIDRFLPGVEIDNGLIKTMPNSFVTSRENVFVGGDLIRGASTVVAAVADGMKAAMEINEYLRGKK